MPLIYMCTLTNKWVYACTQVFLSLDIFPYLFVLIFINKEWNIAVKLVLCMWIICRVPVPFLLACEWSLERGGGDVNEAQADSETLRATDDKQRLETVNTR